MLQGPKGKNQLFTAAVDSRKVLVSVVIPARNEEETLGRVLGDLQKIVEQSKDYIFEVIVVNDHSTDKTEEVMRRWEAVGVSNERSPGKGNALITGFEKSSGEIVIMMDADYSHRCEEIPVFLSLIRAGFGLVVGSRWTGGSEEYTFVRHFGNVFLTLCFWMVSGHWVTDALNGFKAFRRDLVHEHAWRSSDFEIEIELLITALRKCYKIGEFSSYERARAGGKMKSAVVRHGWRFLWCIVKLGVPYRLSQIGSRFKETPVHV